MNTLSHSASDAATNNHAEFLIVEKPCCIQTPYHESPSSSIRLQLYHPKKRVYSTSTSPIAQTFTTYLCPSSFLLSNNFFPVQPLARLSHTSTSHPFTQPPGQPASLRPHPSSSTMATSEEGRVEFVNRVTFSVQRSRGAFSSQRSGEQVKKGA